MSSEDENFEAYLEHLNGPGRFLKTKKDESKSDTIETKESSEKKGVQSTEPTSVL